MAGAPTILVWVSAYLSSADLALARRMEGAEAANAFRLMRGTMEIDPARGWDAEHFLGGCAMFGGVGSPVTHLLGGGVNGPVTEEEFDRLQEFFRRRGSPCLIDLCPLADPSVVEQIFKRGYKVIEFNNLLARVIGDEVPPAPPAGVEIRKVLAEEAREFTTFICRGFSPGDEADPTLVESLSTMPLFGHSFVATVDGEWAGGATTGLEDGVGLLAGDAVRAPFRGRGVQPALIRHRLSFLKEQGADLAMVTVIPGTASHRNYERAGFRLIYMRVNVSREWQ